jgi:hypothetical protein
MTESAQVEFAGMIRLPDPLIAALFVTLFALTFFCVVAQAETIAFELHVHPDGPIAFINYAPTTIRNGADRRQFVTVNNESRKNTAALVFQQTLLGGAKTEIVTLSRSRSLSGPVRRSIFRSALSMCGTAFRPLANSVRRWASRYSVSYAWSSSMVRCGAPLLANDAKLRAVVP